MKIHCKKLFLLIFMMLLSVFCISQITFARANNEIEVYKMGNSSITIKWTPYTVGGANVEKYSVGYKILGDAGYTYIDVDGSLESLDYNGSSNEFSKKISGLEAGTIYEIKIDTYLQNNPMIVSYYTSIATMTQIVIDKTVDTISNPYGNDSVGHIDFSFIAPNEISGGILSSVLQSNIEGYRLIVSSSEGEIYSSGQPYKVLYDNVSGKHKIYKVTNEPLTYGGTQFEFDSQLKDGNDLMAFSLYKTNQPSQDNFELAKTYYIIVTPIFKSGSGYGNVIVSATQNYETIETISTLLPITISQVENDLVKLQFPQVGTGSMTYEVYRGRLEDSLSKIHTEYNDGTRTTIQYYNKITDPLSGDIYYFQVSVAGNEIKSKVVPITISLTPNIAPVLNNILIEDTFIDSVNNSADIILSWDKPQIEDVHKANLNYRIYLNADRTNQVYDNDVVYDENGDPAVDLNNKIILNTKKDINNNDILYNGYPVVFERITQISPSTLSGSDDPYDGDDPVGNFLISGNNYYNILRDGSQVTRTLYRISGIDFLSNGDAPIIAGEPHVVYESLLEGELNTDYKNKIELNTTYFLKMSTYNTAIAEKSDFSLITSFTTPKDIVDEVPSPEEFGVETIGTNSIGLVWNNINESAYAEENVTYELFMSDSNSYSDDAFFKVMDGIETTVNDVKHLLIDTSYTLEGGQATAVLPNKVYLFKVRATWQTYDDVGNNIQVNSGFSNIVPVTTKRQEIPVPEVNTPLAPIDFILTNISTKNASFQWTGVDDTSTYRIVRTTVPIGQFESLTVTGQGVTGEFAKTGPIFSYTESGLFANTLYYFSIRSETMVNNQIVYSSWITIPVTTILVEQPTELTMVNRDENGHSITISWKGKANLDYEVYYRTDASIIYTLAKMITGDINNPNDKSFQAIVSGLKSNTLYYIKVRGKDPSTGMYSKYTENILIRTEFNQKDYDKEVMDSEKEEIITDIQNEWINAIVVSIGKDENNNVLWLNPNKANDMELNSRTSNYKIDLRESLNSYSNIYIPLDLIETLNNKKEILEVKVPQGNIYFRPEILNSKTLAETLEDNDIKLKMFKIEVKQLSNQETKGAILSSDYIASKMYDISFKVVGYDKSEEELTDIIKEAIDSITDVQKNFAQYRTKEQIMKDIEDEFKGVIKSAIDNAFVKEVSVNNQIKQKIRMDFSFNIDRSGKTGKYVAYIRNGNDSYQIQGQIVGNGRIQFEIDRVGKIAIIGKKAPKDIIGQETFEDVQYLLNHYDFKDEVVNNNFREAINATITDAATFIVNVLSPSGDNYDNLSDIQKAQTLGLFKGSDIWSYTGYITREQLAYLIAKAYEISTGISTTTIKMNSNISLLDDNEINEIYKPSVYFVLETNIMSNYSYKMFGPSGKMTRGDLATVLVNVIEKIENIE